MASELIPSARAPRSDRFTNLTKVFVEKFNVQPHFFVRVPGRVNLIGEHVDYCGYPVLPMAIEQDVIVAVRGILDPTIRLTNTNPNYPDYEGSISVLPLRDDKPIWHEYVLCGIIGASKLEFNNADPDGILMAVCGSIPPAAGLSSSSALVCASALAFLHCNKVSLSKMEMAALCARSEKLIGTDGGGMDQAIAFLAKEGFAQYITWNPLTVTPVLLPDDAVFVVAHSLAEANKAATQDFNNRVKECRYAAQMIANSQGYIKESKDPLLTLQSVQQLLGIDLYKMRELVDDLPQTVDELKVRNRAIHVIEEAMRVEKFRSLCETLYTSDDWEEELGECMRASHRSLAELYECSHPNLDELVRLSEKFGVSARLTGAGWGGCIVALCTREKAVKYVDMLMNNYYSKHPRAAEKNVSELVFITAPKQGALLYSVN